PFLLGAGTQEALEVAAWMQSLAAPIGGGEERHLDILERHQARAIKVVDEAAPRDLARRVRCALGQLLPRQRRRTGDRPAGPPARGPVCSDAMLHAQHLAWIPCGAEARQDAAMARELAVVVGEAFPDAERCEVRRPQRADLPLVGGEIGDAVE